MGLIFNHLSASNGFLDGQSRNAGAISGSMYFEPGGGEATGGSNDHAKRGFPGHKDAAYVFSGSAADGATDKAVFLGHVVVSGSLSLGGGSTFLEGTGGPEKVAIFQDADTVVTGGLAFDETNDRLFVGDAANNPSQVLLGSGSVLFHHLGTEGGTVSGISTSANNLKLGLTSSHAGGQVELAGAAGVTIGSNNQVGLGLNSVGHVAISTGSGGGSNQIIFNPRASFDSGNGALTSDITLNAQIFGIDASGNVTIDSDAAVTLGGASIDVDSDGGTITVDAGGSAISIGSNGADAGAINVGTSTGARTITVGNNASAEVEVNALRVDINAGSNGLQVDAGAASEIRTSAGRLVIDGKTGVQIQEDGGVVLEVDDAKDVNLGVAGRFVNVLGNLMVQGTTTTVTSSNMTIADPIIGLGITGSEGFNNLGDRALIFGKGAAAGAFLPAINWDGSKFEFGTFKATPLSSSMGDVQVAAPIVAGAITSGDLTEDRVVIAGTNGILEDDANFTFDGSDLQLANGVGLVFSTDDAEKIESDGTDLKIQTGGLIKLLSANTSGGDVEEFLRFASGSAVVEIQPQGTVADTDLVFKESGGNEVFRVDASAESLLMATTKQIQLGTAGRNITDAGNDIVITSDNDVRIAGTSKLEFGADGSGEHVVSDGTNLEVVSGGGVELKSGGHVSVEAGQEIRLRGLATAGEKVHSTGAGLVDIDAGTAVLISAGGSGETLRFTTNAIIPAADNNVNLGSASARFNNIFTGDLNLRNDRGDWTLIEENDFISFRNNKTGRRFRMVMEDITGTGTYGPGNDGEM